MPKYLISWTEETYYNAIVEAASADEADAIFSSMDFDWESAKVVGSEMQDSVEIEEVNEQA